MSSQLSLGLISAVCVVMLTGCSGDDAIPLDEDFSEDVASESQPINVNLGTHIKNKIAQNTQHNYEFWRVSGNLYTVHLKWLSGDPDLYCSDVPITDAPYPANTAKQISVYGVGQNDWCGFKATTTGWNYTVVYGSSPYSESEYEFWVTSP